MIGRGIWLSTLVGSLVLACAGKEAPPPKTADEPAPSEPAVKPASGEDTGGGDEAWEGEKEATAGSAAGGEKHEPMDAPPDTGKTETRTMEVIQKVVKDNRKPVRACYEKARKDLPDLAGTMTIHFVLDAEGKVKKADLNQERSTLKAPPVVNCAIEVIKGIKFPPSSRGMETEVNYPFGFEK